MVFGYTKDKFVIIAGQILIYSTVQLSFMGSELDNKFSIVNSINTIPRLNVAVQSFRRYIFICTVWILLTASYFFYAYGVGALVMYLLLSGTILIYNIVSYNRVFDEIRRKLNA